MKYFTKEFYKLYLLIEKCRAVQAAESAETKNESFYLEIYEKSCAEFLKNESEREFYRDPADDMRAILDYINEDGVSEEEFKDRLQFKERFIAMHEKRLKNRKYFKFNEELCRRKFAEKQNFYIELCRLLPKDIYDGIADERMFALGFVSAEVKLMLRVFCAESKKRVAAVAGAAYSETFRAESFLKKRLNLGEFGGVNLLRIEERDGDVCLKTGDKTLLIADGVITEGRGKPVYPFTREIPDRPWTRILASELHRLGGKFELSFLLSNLSETEKNDFWYLDITCTDITEA